VVFLVGGTGPLLDRARALSASGSTDEIQKALHLVDFVLFNGGAMASEACELKADLLEARSKQERSFVAHNILASAALLQREHGSAVRGAVE
jgi:hypothetical protein